MSFEPKKQAYNTSINAVTLGTGDKAIVIGGQNVLPFYSFDAPIENAPKVGVEVSHAAPTWTTGALAELYAGCTTLAEVAAKAATIPGVDFLALNFAAADPNGANRSTEECVADAVAVAAVTDLPLVILGCKNIDKDSELLPKLAEALMGKNALFMAAKNENYKTVGASVALACGQKLGAETADDINLAKQLNIMLKGLNVNPESVVMDIGTAAVGYGYEYAASTFDRIRLAGLAQGDADLKMPILAVASVDAWGVKESTATEEDEPAWGCQEERAINMEISTAAADLVGGADAIVLRHPAAIATIKKFITELV